MKVSRSDIMVNEGWIYVRGIGTIGIYGKSEKAILLDYSMKFIIGTNESIPCASCDVEEKVLALLNKQ